MKRKIRFGIVVFPGSNCERDAYHVLHEVLQQDAEYIWHEKSELDHFDCVLLPGGFSYGDYLRTGAIARFAPIMNQVEHYAAVGKGLVIGICNGFQILTEAGLLPGALQRNASLKFVCKTVELSVVNNKTPFTLALSSKKTIQLPIAHGEGNYTCDQKTLAMLKKNKQILFQYVDNPNGSVADIAGICNEQRNVFGLMPHPERASEAVLGSVDGRKIFESMIQWASTHSSS